MTAVPNHALRQLRAGKLAIGLGLRQARTVDIAQIAKTARLRLAVHRLRAQLDGPRHRGADRGRLARRGRHADRARAGLRALARLARARQRRAGHRVSARGYGRAGAPRIADYCRYPPIGHRSMGGGLQQLGFASMPVGEAARIVNEETLVVVMLESPQAIDNCEAIAAVPGIDALLIGTNDLCFEMGIPGQFNDPRVADAYTKLIAACRKHGKFPGHGRHVHARAPRAPHRHGRAADPVGLGFLAADAGGTARGEPRARLRALNGRGQRQRSKSTAVVLPAHEHRDALAGVRLVAARGERRERGRAAGLDHDAQRVPERALGRADRLVGDEPARSRAPGGSGTRALRRAAARTNPPRCRPPRRRPGGPPRARA